MIWIQAAQLTAAEEAEKEKAEEEAERAKQVEILTNFSLLPDWCCVEIS